MGEQRAGVGEHGQAGLSDRQPFGLAAQEQLDSEGALELADGQGDRRLGDVLAGRGARDGSGLGRRHEEPELAQ
jgi:hypothetical protein